MAVCQTSVTPRLNAAVISTRTFHTAADVVSNFKNYSAFIHLWVCSCMNCNPMFETNNLNDKKVVALRYELSSDIHNSCGIWINLNRPCWWNKPLFIWRVGLGDIHGEIMNPYFYEVCDLPFWYTMEEDCKHRYFPVSTTFYYMPSTMDCCLILWHYHSMHFKKSLDDICLLLATDITDSNKIVKCPACIPQACMQGFHVHVQLNLINRQYIWWKSTCLL